MRRILELFIVFLFLLPVACAKNTSSKMEKEIEKNILQRMVAFEAEKRIKITWGGKLEIVRKESEPHWAGKIVHFRAGFFPAEIETDKGAVRAVEIAFVSAYGEEDGKIVSGKCDVVDALFQEDPEYKARKKELIKEMKTVQPWPRKTV